MNGEKNGIQELRDFTVQIRHTATDAIVGTGIVVSDDGKIATCAHVVVAAGVNPNIGRPIPSIWAMLAESIPGRKTHTHMDIRKAEVGVYFPRADGDETQRLRRATIMTCFAEHEDDVVLLQLVGGPPPSGAKPAVLGAAKLSERNPFYSYGYTPTGDNPATRTDGTILGTVERAQGSNLRVEQVQLRAPEIDAGMSGAAVLDTSRNLVVGLIAARSYSSTNSPKSNISYAVDSYVLTISPFNLSVNEASLPLGAALQPKTDVVAAHKAAVSKPGNALSGAPSPLEEWVGREELLQAISADWSNSQRRVTGLIGFGGEGKSSVARHWLDTLLADPSQPQPDGVFWWGFYDRPSVDEFFVAAVNYLTAGQDEPYKQYSSTARAHLIGAMLSTGRYLFVLDGIEVLLHQQGDQYGSFTRGDLRDFSELLAATWHNSFSLVTSRTPLLDLAKYTNTTYVHRDVDRLNPTDGRALLRKLGVDKGSDAVLDQVVANWDGHALTLNLLGTYLTERYGGDVTHIRDIPIPTADEQRYERVHRVLRRYDEHLTAAERSFMLLFSAFRTPIGESAFAKVFRPRVERNPAFPSRPFGQKPHLSIGPTNSLNAPISALGDAAFEEMLKRLLKYHILRRDQTTHSYTTHPLIRAHYLARLHEADFVRMEAVHTDIKDYYLAIARDPPYVPTLDDLKPLIEVVHHACSAGAYDEAWDIFWGRVYQRGRKVLITQLGATEVALEILGGFFPEGDTSQDPLVSNLRSKSTILNEVGLRLQDVGRLRVRVEILGKLQGQAIEAAPVLARRQARPFVTEENYTHPTPTGGSTVLRTQQYDCA